MSHTLHKTKIEWADYSWPVVNGCRRASPGCVNCYAEQLEATRLIKTPKYAGLATYTDAGARWTGETRLWVDDLRRPLRTSKAGKVFVCDMGDLFYEGVRDETIAAVCGAALLAGWHTYQFLTKRPERYTKFFRQWSMDDCIEVLCRQHPEQGACAHLRDGICDRCSRGATERMRAQGRDPQSEQWPPPWWWFGASAEDQRRADERIPKLLEFHEAAVRFVSYEPALEAVDFRPWLHDSTCADPGRGEPSFCICSEPLEVRLDWGIIGGESGRNARRFEIQWAENAIAQFSAAGVPVFFKQAGSKPTFGGVPLTTAAPKGGDLSELPRLVHRREFPCK